ncbi:MAG TPA: hypothetical protein DD670_02725 [Planctomycetaceae bacterium]|nr:hypothetical protein [Planctomycetaceae bacterium]
MIVSRVPNIPGDVGEFVLSWVQNGYHSASLRPVVVAIRCRHAGCGDAVDSARLDVVAACCQKATSARLPGDSPIHGRASESAEPQETLAGSHFLTETCRTAFA